MKPLLGTFYLLGMLVLRGLGHNRSPAQQAQKVVDKTVTPWRSLETYSYNKYHPMEEIYRWMSQISEKYADVVTQRFLGVTYETRPMYYLKISHPSDNAKKIIWMDCGIHAREWIAPAFCQWFVKEILQNYQDNSRIRRFLTYLDFYVLPVLNIDGYIYTWTTDRLWRKSRSSHNDSACFGTDLNRNFNSSWCSIGASKDCRDDTFCGAGPTSEPETKAVSRLIESKKEDVLCFLTIHSYGQLILTPYGYTKNKSSNHEELQNRYYVTILQDRERLESLLLLIGHLVRGLWPQANGGKKAGEAWSYDVTIIGSYWKIQVGQKAANALKAKHGTNYRVGASADTLYPLSGSSRDWAKDIGIPFSYTFELRDNGTHQFVLPEAQIQDTCEETMEAVLSILDDVYAKYWPSNSAGKVTSTTVVLSLLVPFRSLF